MDKEKMNANKTPQMEAAEVEKSFTTSKNEDNTYVKGPNINLE